MTLLERLFLDGLDNWRVWMAGELMGDSDISSPSSSAFRFRLFDMLLCGKGDTVAEVRERRHYFEGMAMGEACSGAPSRLFVQPTGEAAMQGRFFVRFCLLDTYWIVWESVGRSRAGEGRMEAAATAAHSLCPKRG